jgi:hypothetical protein
MRNVLCFLHVWLWAAVLYFAMHPFADAHAEPAKKAPDVQDVIAPVVRLDVGGHYSGTAIVVTPDGYVLTSPRNVVGAKYFPLTVGDAKIPARLVAIDEKHDFAVLKADKPLPRWAMLETAPGPAKGDKARIAGYVSMMSDPPMIERKHAEGTVTDPHFKGESAGNLDLSDLLIIRRTGEGEAPKTDGSAVFSAKTGRLIGITIGKTGSGAYIAIPSAVIRTFLASQNIAVPSP